MGIRWKVKREVEVEQDLLVREVGKSMVFDATIDDLRRACEAVGYDRAIADCWRAKLAERDAEIEAAVERAEKAEAKLARLRTTGVSVRDDGTIVDVRDIPPTGSRIATLEADLAAALARIAELEAPMPEATVEELERVGEAAYTEAWNRSSCFDSRRAASRAVAERVRRERPQCLIARAVAGGVSVKAINESTGWYVVASGLRGMDCKDRVPAAEVPAELARMLTEVGA